MGTLNKQDLLDQIEKCPINFDPLFDHCYGLEQPPKIAFVPLPLWESIKKELSLIPPCTPRPLNPLDCEYIGLDEKTGKYVVHEQLYPESRGYVVHEFATEQEARKVSA